MKSIQLVLTAFFLATALPLLADELLENGDFSDGTTHWHGDAKAAGADSSTDLVSGNNSGGAKGIQVDLHPSTWTTVKQEMHALKRDVTPKTLAIKIDYQVSPDFSLTDRPDDYKGDDNSSVGPNLGFDSARIRGRPGQLMVFIDVEPSNRNVMQNNQMVFLQDAVFMQSFAPKTGGAQTYSGPLPLPRMVNVSGDATFVIAIPPGHGSISITGISLVK